MADINLYFYVEDIALTVAQRNTLVEQLKLIGRKDTDGNPKNRNHWRVRPDNKAVIFEGWFDDTHLSAVGIRNRLASIFGVANTSITYTTNNTAYGPVVVYSYQSTERLRIGVFGGTSTTYAQSYAAVLDFLSDNQATWE